MMTRTLPVAVLGVIALAMLALVFSYRPEHALSQAASVTSWKVSSGSDWIITDSTSLTPITFTKSSSILPVGIYGSQLAVIGNTAYLFGGVSSANIYSASTDNPTSWTSTGASLPATKGYAQLAIIGSNLYLFGGTTGTGRTQIPTNTIFTAPVSNPTAWTDTGATLPGSLRSSQLAVIGNTIYLFGGFSSTGSTNVIYSAPVSNPTAWTNTGATLPGARSSAQLAVIGNTIYLFGGIVDTFGPTSTIYSAPISNPTVWTDTGSVLPGVVAAAQLAIIGNSVYLFGGSAADSAQLIYSGNTAITGYLWSDNIGWVDLNCINTRTCATNNFGMSINATGGISGYAWGDNIGWISANGSDLTGCPSGTCSASIATSTSGTSVVKGWFKAIGADGNGWDGFISLDDKSGSTYGPTLTSGAFSGYAWGSTNIGWLDFRYANTTWNSCTANYYCSGNDQYYQNAQCVSTKQQTCAYLCQSGACVAPPAPTGTISAHPSLVHSGATVSVSWSVTNANTCAVSGTNGDAWTGTSGTKTSKAIMQNTTFTLACTNALNATSTVGTATVTIVPAWKEI